MEEKTISEVMREMGRKGGSVRSQAKREAARRRWAARMKPAAAPEAQPKSETGGPVLLIGAPRERD